MKSNQFKPNHIKSNQIRSCFVKWTSAEMQRRNPDLSSLLVSSFLIDRTTIAQNICHDTNRAQVQGLRALDRWHARYDGTVQWPTGKHQAFQQ